MYKKISFIFSIIISMNFFNLFSKESPNNNTYFLTYLKHADDIINNEKNNNNISASLQEKINILETLNHYIDTYKYILFQHSNDITKEELKEIKASYLLTKQINNKLKKHLLKHHSWTNTNNFHKITKPIIYSSGITISFIALTKILEKLDFISHIPQRNKTALIYGTLLASLWITKNYIE